MKLIKIIGHPVLVMSMFLLLLISGESFGGFYFIFLLLGLPHGVPHAILAFAGLIAMFIGYKIYRKHFNPIKPLLYLIGNALMIFALVTFFEDSKGYTYSTFHQAVPLISFSLFGLCVLCNLLTSLMLFVNRTTKVDEHLRVAS